MEQWIHLDLYGDDQLWCRKCEKDMKEGDTAVIYQDKGEDSSVYCSECWDMLSGRQVIEERKNENN